MYNGQGTFYCLFNGSKVSYDFIKVVTLEGLYEISTFNVAHNKQPQMVEESNEIEFDEAYKLAEKELNNLKNKWNK